MDSTFSVDDYRALLIKFYRFYSSIEPRLPAAALEDEGFNIAPRMKAPRLEQDLTALGHGPAAKAVPAWAGVPDVSTVARAWGSIYVMEGGTLGGQVITRHLRDNLGISPETGGSFFNSYGSDVGRMWKEFGAAITAFAERHPEKEDEIVEAARDTFDSFRLCFEQPTAAA
jgi:heme oxygenase